VQFDGKADVADVARHVVADADPSFGGTIEPVQAAVVLLVQPVGHQRVHPHAMGVVAEGRVGTGQEVGGAPHVQRPPIRPAVNRLEHAAAREPEVQVVVVARIDQDRVQHRPVGRPLDVRPLGPGSPVGVVVPAVERLPGDAAVARAEQALR
jgi:hypothetical protein